MGGPYCSPRAVININQLTAEKCRVCFELLMLVNNCWKCLKMLRIEKCSWIDKFWLKLSEIVLCKILRFPSKMSTLSIESYEDSSLLPKKGVFCNSVKIFSVVGSLKILTTLFYCACGKCVLRCVVTVNLCIVGMCM